MQLAGKKFSLVAYQCLERVAKVEIEMSCVITLDLTKRCRKRVLHCLGRRRNGVGVADAEQDWERDLLRRTAGPVGSDGGSDPRRDFVAEARVGRQQRLITGQSVWLNLQVSKPPADAVQIEVVAQQFQWNFHYAGADKQFGRTAPQYINDRALNFVGIDPTDARGKDDIQTTTLLIPVDRPVNLTLHSKDVIHSLFIPALRIKQDAVPGLGVRLSFTAQQTGKYEIACAELCGSLHYNMKAYLLVLTKEEYDNLAAMPDAQFKQRVSELFKQYN